MVPESPCSTSHPWADVSVTVPDSRTRVVFTTPTGGFPTTVLRAPSDVRPRLYKTNLPTNPVSVEALEEHTDLCTPLRTRSPPSAADDSPPSRRTVPTVSDPGPSTLVRSPGPRFRNPPDRSGSVRGRAPGASGPETQVTRNPQRVSRDSTGVPTRKGRGSDWDLPAEGPNPLRTTVTKPTETEVSGEKGGVTEVWRPPPAPAHRKGGDYGTGVVMTFRTGVQDTVCPDLTNLL